MTDLERLLLERELATVLGRYARLCDERNWDLMDQVFSAEAHAQYGGLVLPNPAVILAMLQNNLGGCGPTQHLLGNLDVEVKTVDGLDRVSSRMEVRAAHRGAGAMRHETYECMGHYNDHWQYTESGGWRIADRTMVVAFEFGNRKVLAPTPAAEHPAAKR